MGPAAPAPMRVVVAVVASLGVAACALSEPSDEPVLDPRVRVLPHVEGLIVDASSVTIPHASVAGLETIAAGDILVSAQGEGFLRAVDVVRTGADTTTLATHDASLDDALVEAHIATALGGDGKADTYQLPAINFGVHDKRVIERAGGTLRIIDAELALRPSVDLDLAIADRRLENFELVVRGQLRGSLDLEIDARDLAAGAEITLWESPPAVFYQQIGILPLVETVSTSVVLKVDAVARGAGYLRATASANADLAGGIRYSRTGGGWEPVADLALDAHAGIPEATLGALNQAGVSAWLNVRLNVRLYGVAGPHVAVGPQLEVVRDFVENDFDATARFRGAVGGDLKIAGYTLNAVPKLYLW